MPIKSIACGNVTNNDEKQLEVQKKEKTPIPNIWQAGAYVSDNTTSVNNVSIFC